MPDPAEFSIEHVTPPQTTSTDYKVSEEGYLIGSNGQEYEIEIHLSGGEQSVFLHELLKTAKGDKTELLQLSKEINDYVQALKEQMGSFDTGYITEKGNFVADSKPVNAEKAQAFGQKLLGTQKSLDNRIRSIAKGTDLIQTAGERIKRILEGLKRQEKFENMSFKELQKEYEDFKEKVQAADPDQKLYEKMFDLKKKKMQSLVSEDKFNAYVATLAKCGIRAKYMAVKAYKDRDEDAAIKYLKEAKEWYKQMDSFRDKILPESWKQVDGDIPVAASDYDYLKKHMHGKGMELWMKVRHLDRDAHVKSTLQSLFEQIQKD